MSTGTLGFDRPDSLVARVPPRARGLARDEVRLLASSPAGHTHTIFRDFAAFLDPGDLVVVNRSATLPASLPARGPDCAFTLNLSTRFARDLWLAEPRWSHARPGPLPLSTGTEIRVAGRRAQVLDAYTGIPRLRFVRFEAAVDDLMTTHGSPIRYGYVDRAWPLRDYQTVFGAEPGSAEMPSASHPFTNRVVDSLRARGVGIAELTLHTGVSSLEVDPDDLAQLSLYPEPFAVPRATAQAVNATRSRGGRVIAAGTTVVRALESAWAIDGVRSISGFTRQVVHPGVGVRAVDGLVTGFHDPVTSHLAMLFAVARSDVVIDAYSEAVAGGYLWHEWGDSHLLLAH